MSAWKFAFALIAAAPATVFAPSALAQDAAAGERQFKARCGSCHSVEAGQNRIGPELSRVVGREAGSVDGARYSAAPTCGCRMNRPRSMLLTATTRFWRKYG